MSVKVTLEFPTAADAAAFLQDFDGADAPAGVTAAGEPAAARGRGRPRKDAAAAAAPVAAPAAAVNAAPAPSPTAPAATPSAAAVPFQAVADAITALAEKDRDKAVSVLKSHGVNLASELKPDQWASVVAACNAALAPAATSLI